MQDGYWGLINVSTEIMTNQELQSRAIDVMRFPLAVMVVAIHTYFCEALKARGNVDVPFTGVWAHEFITFFSIVLTDAAVPTFFVISGYLYFVKTNTQSIECYDWGGYLKKTRRKCLTLLIPYFMWNLVAFLIEPSNYAKPVMDILTGFYSINGHGPWDGPLWFMRDLFLMMLFAPLFELGIKKIKMALPIILWIIYVGNFLGDSIVPGLSYVGLAFFSLGAYSGIWQKGFINSLRNNKIKIIGLYLLMLLARIITMHQWGDMSIFTTTVASLVDMLYIASTIPAWFVIASYIGEHTQCIDIWRWLASSGFVIYAMHRLFNSKVSALGLYLIDKPELSGREAVILYFITISITVLVCIATYWTLGNFKLSSILFLGARSKH